MKFRLNMVVFNILSILASVGLMAALSEAAQETEGHQARARAFTIAPQPLSKALLMFAEQTEIEVLFDARLAQGKNSPGAQGTYTPKEALEQLLSETGLHYRFTSDNSITIKKTVPPNISGPIRLKSVTVTARKREEDIREVPFSVSAIGQEELKRARVINSQVLGRRAANLNYISAFARGGNRLNIRGVGDPAGGFAADDTSVGYFVDGVPLPLLAIDGDLLDIKQVEILRGPQNVLFGRNAQGGAISISTADPSEEPEFSVGAEYGNLLQRKVTAIASGPFTDAIGGRLAVQYRGRDGDIPNDLGEDLRDIDVVNVLGKLTADLGTNTDASLFVRYEHQDEDFVFGVLREDSKFPRARQDIDPDQITENLATGLTVNHRINNLTLTSITSFYYTDYDFLNDQTDGRVFGTSTGLPFNSFDDPSVDFSTQDVTEHRINQEFRLSGEIHSIDWLLGANFFYSNYDADFKNNLPVFFLFGDFISEIKTKSYDVFGNATVPLTDRIRIDAALRYTYEKEEFDGGFMANSAAAPIAANEQRRSATFDFVTGRFSISYDLFDDTTVYATVARGGKAGGFSNFDTDLAFAPGAKVDQFGTATTLSYELGARGRVWDDRLRFSIASFFNQTKDEQLSVFNEVTFTSSLENIDTESYGAEFEITAQPIDTLLIQGSLGLLHTEITKAPADSGAKEGGDIPFAPEVSFSLGADYWYPIDRFGLPGDLVFGAEYQYVGSRDVDVANTVSLDSYDVLNLRMGFVTEDFEVIAFAQNVLDESYPVGGFVVGTDPAGNPVTRTGGVGQPRLYGMSAKIRF